MRISTRALLKAELFPKRPKLPPKCLFCTKPAQFEGEVIGLVKFRFCALERCVQIPEKPSGWSFMQRLLRAIGGRRMKFGEVKHVS